MDNELNREKELKCICSKCSGGNSKKAERNRLASYYYYYKKPRECFLGFYNKKL